MVAILIIGGCIQEAYIGIVDDLGIAQATGSALVHQVAGAGALNVLLGSSHELLAYHTVGQLVGHSVSLHYHLALVHLGEISLVDMRCGHGGQACAHKHKC